MSQSPFAKRLSSQGSQTCRRRSSRVDWVVPIVLSGRDAAGQVFREATETCIVNLHGARIKTQQAVLLGMQITVENPTTGQSEKAICVRVEEPQPGEDFHYIAVQLIHPCNLWGMEQPPEDWARVQAEMVDGTVPSQHQPGKVATLPPRQPSPPTEAPRRDPEEVVAEIERKSAALIESLITNLRTQSEVIVVDAFQQVEQRLEESAARMEARLSVQAEQALASFKSSLETYQVETMAEIVREATRSFDQQIQTRLAAAESRMGERAGQVSDELESALETLRADTMGELVRDAVQDLETTLKTFRADVADELAARRNEFVESTEQALREKVSTMLSSILGPAAATKKEAGPAASKRE